MFIKPTKTDWDNDNKRPPYVFQLGENYTEKKLLSLGIGWELIIQDTEEWLLRYS